MADSISHIEIVYYHNMALNVSMKGSIIYEPHHTLNKKKKKEEEKQNRQSDEEIHFIDCNIFSF